MKKWTFGIDLGGTEIKLGLFDDQLQKYWAIPTNCEDQGIHILEDIAKTIKACCDEYGITVDTLAGVGIGVPGLGDMGRAVRLQHHLNVNVRYPVCRQRCDGTQGCADNGAQE